MKVVDARSGKEMKIGDVVEYPDGEFVRLVDVDEGLFSASAVVDVAMIDYSQGATRAAQQPLIKKRMEVPLTVRWLHPSFLFQHVAFLNT